MGPTYGHVVFTPFLHHLYIYPHLHFSLLHHNISKKENSIFKLKISFYFYFNFSSVFCKSIHLSFCKTLWSLCPWRSFIVSPFKTPCDFGTGIYKKTLHLIIIQTRFTKLHFQPSQLPHSFPLKGSFRIFIFVCSGFLCFNG